MRKRVSIFGIVIIMILCVGGVSFALWSFTLQQTDMNVITTGCFQIEFRDKNPIHLDKVYPISDVVGKTLIPYEFTITNICNSFASYQINLEILDTSTLENLDYLKIMLDEKVDTLTENEVVTKTLTNAKTSYKLVSGYLRENRSKTYNLRLWMDENTPTDEAYMNKLFESKVTVIATYKENLDNKIEVSAVSQNNNFSGSETFQIHVVSENYDLVSMSDDLQTWEEFETKGKDIIVEKTVIANGSYTYYFQDEAGNIKEVTVVATKIDDKKPVANMSVEVENNVIKIDASSSRDSETRVVNYYYSRDGKTFTKTTTNTINFSLYDYGIATTMLENYKNQKIYLKVEDAYGNVSDVKEYELTTSELLYDETVDNNLRYVGSNPNNYVSFNDESWRIIGNFNNIDDGSGKKETRIKLIRNESIGEYSWDSSTSNVNSGYGVNEWSQADLMKLLNPGYENESVGGSLYWNRKSGTCYNGRNNATTSCNFTSNGILEKTKSFIGITNWNLGSNGNEAAYDNIKTTQFYNLERSLNTGKICTSGELCSDKVVRTTSWNGFIGLMYPSDYGYAVGGGSTNRKDCFSLTLYRWGESTLTSCKNNNWLYKSETGSRLLTPSTSSISATRAYSTFDLRSDGHINNDRASFKYSIYPTLYLKANIKIISGIGSEQNPFLLSLN